VRLNEHGIDTTIKTFQGLGRSHRRNSRANEFLLFFSSFEVHIRNVQLLRQEFLFIFLKDRRVMEPFLMMAMTWLCKRNTNFIGSMEGNRRRNDAVVAAACSRHRMWSTMTFRK